MRLRIATWNINSVRLRIDLVRRLAAEERPHVLCLQETKARIGDLPLEALEAMGFKSVVARGQPAYNGVATLARVPLEDAGERDFCGRGEARHAAARLRSGLLVENLYVPAGGDAPDAEANPKFAHKLAFLEEMRDRGAPKGPAILLGDFNVAPLENDVWSHRQMRNVVSHTEPEIERLLDAQRAGGWVDGARLKIPEPERLYTWWSYRARDWSASDRGRRLDHIWVTPDLANSIRRVRVLRHARGWERPSDHAPLIMDLAL